MPVPAAIMALETTDFMPCVSDNVCCVTFSSLIEGGGPQAHTSHTLHVTHYYAFTLMENKRKA